MSNYEYKYCPYCFEEVSKKSIKCRFCKSFIKRADKDMPSLENVDPSWLRVTNTAELSDHNPNSKSSKPLPGKIKYAGECIQIKPNGVEETNYPHRKIYPAKVKNIEEIDSQIFASVRSQNPNGDRKNGKQIRLPGAKKKNKPASETMQNSENAQKNINRDQISFEIERLFGNKEKPRSKIDWKWVKHGCGRDWHLHEAQSVYKGINVNCFDSLKHAERNIFFTFGLDNRIFNSESDLIRAIEEVIRNSDQLTHE